MAGGAPLQVSIALGAKSISMPVEPLHKSLSGFEGLKLVNAGIVALHLWSYLASVYVTLKQKNAELLTSRV